MSTLTGHQFNQTGDYGIKAYGSASEEQHIATRVGGGRQRTSQRQRTSRRQRTSQRQRGGRRQRTSQRQRTSRRQRQQRQQRGGK